MRPAASLRVSTAGAPTVMSIAASTVIVRLRSMYAAWMRSVTVWSTARNFFSDSAIMSAPLCFFR